MVRFEAFDFYDARVWCGNHGGSRIDHVEYGPACLTAEGQPAWWRAAGPGVSISCIPMWRRLTMPEGTVLFELGQGR